MGKKSKRKKKIGEFSAILIPKDNIKLRASWEVWDKRRNKLILILSKLDKF
jgi:hypothetical protein